MNRRRLINVAVVAGVALLVVASLIAYEVSRPVTRPSVRFLGYTNLNNKLVGAFKVANGNQGPANLYVDSMLWARARVSEPEKLRQWASVQYYMIEALTNQQSVLVYLAPPTNGLSWQTSFRLREPENEPLNDWRDNFNLPRSEAKVVSIETGLIPASKGGPANSSQSIRSE